MCADRRGRTATTNFLHTWYARDVHVALLLLGGSLQIQASAATMIRRKVALAAIVTMKYSAVGLMDATLKGKPARSSKARLVVDKTVSTKKAVATTAA